MVAVWCSNLHGNGTCSGACGGLEDDIPLKPVQVLSWVRIRVVGFQICDPMIRIGSVVS